MTSPGTHHVIRAPGCPGCGSTEGCIRPASGQDRVFCANCGKWCYNAPRTETGREARSARSRAGIDPGTKARILTRDGYRCFMCGDSPVTSKNTILHIGHLVSVEDGRRAGLTEAQVNNDRNLAAMCEECNLGMGARSVPLRAMFMFLLSRLPEPEP